MPHTHPAQTAEGGILGIELARAQASLSAAELCLANGWLDSAVSGAYYTLFQAAICALEQRGIRRRAWTHKGVHSDFVQLFMRRCKLVPASFAGALPSVLHLRHRADYRQPGVSQPQAARAVRRARECMTLWQREVFDGL
jgi:uncharacterized protein (UPF0332 family)